MTETKQQETKTKRELCDRCKRPKKVCLCASLPATPLPKPSALESVVLMRHPKERNMKNATAQLAQLCFAHITISYAREVKERSRVNDAFYPLFDNPESCALVYPSNDSVLLNEHLAKQENGAKIKHLYLIDATWKFASEMVTRSTIFQNVTKVKLAPPLEGVFVIRKTPDNVAKGMSTAEALGWALDCFSTTKINENTNDNTPENISNIGKYASTIRKTLSCYVEHQLAHTREVKHRVDRPGYVPDLYSGKKAVD